MAKEILSENQLGAVSGGFENGEDIYSYYCTCEDWTCEVCRKKCSENCHICENGGVSRTVCRYCLNYDGFAKACRLGRALM